MGYTHYWYRPVASKIGESAWAKISADAAALVAIAPCKLCREYDEPGTQPIVNDKLIRLNGLGDQGHETFLFAREAPEQMDYRAAEPQVFDFCKTAHKPYDFIVCGILAAIAEYDPSIKVHSDGDFSDWEQPLDWASRVLKRKIAFPVTDD